MRYWGNEMAAKYDKDVIVRASCAAQQEVENLKIL